MVSEEIQLFQVPPTLGFKQTDLCACTGVL